MKISSLLLAVTLSFSVVAGAKNVIEVVRDAGQFTTFLSLLERVELTTALEKTNKITVFAPTDKAFDKLPKATVQFLLNHPEGLRSVLLYHVATKKLPAKKVVKQFEIKTLANKTIQPTVNENGVFLNKTSKVMGTDIKAKNGMVHIINEVLIFDENTPNNNIETAEYVDLSRYLGTWYEIARYPNSFQEKCLGTRATYSRKGSKIRVLNECQLESGKIKKAKGVAKVINTETNAELAVSFVPILKWLGWFAGDYNILALGSDYEYVLVGDRKRSTFWILARNKTLPETLYQDLIELAVEKGYRADLINKSPIWK